MDKYPNLSKNPIIQAVLEIKLEFPESFDINKLKDISKLLSEEYPKHKDRFHQEITFQEKVVSSLKSKKDGIMFFDKMNHKSFVVTSTQLDFFMAHPYESWENFKTEATKVWIALNKIIDPIKVIRVSTRFINRIRIPVDDVVSIKDYFKSYLFISDSLNPETNKFSFQYSTTDPNKITTNVAFSIDTNEKGFLSFLFDIDVLTGFEININKLEEIFELLHDKKNEIFFNTITDKTFNLIK